MRVKASNTLHRTGEGCGKQGAQEPYVLFVFLKIKKKSSYSFEIMI